MELSRGWEKFMAGGAVQLQLIRCQEKVCVKS